MDLIDFTVKANNLINLKNLIKSNIDSCIFYNKKKSIEFLNTGIYLVYILITLNENIKNLKINCLLNKKFLNSLIQLNETSFVINKIIKINRQDIISFKNASNMPINIKNINIKICKL